MSIDDNDSWLMIVSIDDKDSWLEMVSTYDNVSWLVMVSIVNHGGCHYFPYSSLSSERMLNLSQGGHC